MKKILLATAACLAPSLAFGQCNGVFGANTICGNLSGASAPPGQYNANGTVAAVAVDINGAGNIDPTSCGKIVRLNGSSFYAVGTTGSFGDGCRIILKNTQPISGGRGRGINFPGVAAFVLYPQQEAAMTFATSGSVWSMPPLPYWPGGANTFYKNSTLGSNNPLLADGLATGAGAFNTFQYASDFIRNNIQPFVGGTTIQADCDATYNETTQVYRDIGSIINFVGNAGNPGLCLIDRTTGNLIFDVQDGAQATITGFEFAFLSGANNTALSARQLVIMDANSNFVGSNVNVPINVSDISSVNVTSITLFSDAIGDVVLAQSKSAVQFNGTMTVPAANTVSLTNLFGAVDSEIAGTPTYTISGTITGAQFSCSYNAVLNLGTAYPAALTAGSSSTGCQHNP